MRRAGLQGGGVRAGGGAAGGRACWGRGWGVRAEGGPVGGGGAGGRACGGRACGGRGGVPAGAPAPALPRPGSDAPPQAGWSAAAAQRRRAGLGTPRARARPRRRRWRLAARAACGGGRGGGGRCGWLRAPGGLGSAAAAFSGSAAPRSSAQREEAAGGEQQRVRGGDPEGAGERPARARRPSRRPVGGRGLAALQEAGAGGRARARCRGPRHGRRSRGGRAGGRGRPGSRRPRARGAGRGPRAGRRPLRGQGAAGAQRRRPEGAPSRTLRPCGPGGRGPRRAASGVEFRFVFSSPAPRRPSLSAEAPSPPEARLDASPGGGPGRGRRAASPARWLLPFRAARWRPECPRTARPSLAGGSRPPAAARRAENELLQYLGPSVGFSLRCSVTPFPPSGILSSLILLKR